eukprot:1962094-Pleurochrysis_carterae.AAC.3
MSILINVLSAWCVVPAHGALLQARRAGTLTRAWSELVPTTEVRNTHRSFCSPPLTGFGALELGCTARPCAGGGSGTDFLVTCSALDATGIETFNNC